MDKIEQEFQSIVKSIDVLEDFNEEQKIRQYWTNELEKVGFKIAKFEIKRKRKETKKCQSYHLLPQ